MNDLTPILDIIKNQVESSNKFKIESLTITPDDSGGLVYRVYMDSYNDFDIIIAHSLPDLYKELNEEGWSVSCEEE